MISINLVFVTGRGGAGFALGGPAATQARGEYFVSFPRPAPVQGPATLIPWTGPRFSPPKIYGGLSGVWLGWGLGRGVRHAKTLVHTHGPLRSAQTQRRGYATVPHHL